jgi:hypothetical protein
LNINIKEITPVKEKNKTRRKSPINLNSLSKYSAKYLTEIYNE